MQAVSQRAVFQSHAAGRRLGNCRPLAVLERGLLKEVMPKEGGDSIKVNGEYSTILQRQIDGSWKIAIDCFNYDAPPG